MSFEDSEPNLPGDELERYSSELTYRREQEWRAHDKRQRRGLREVEQQFQLPIEGTATGTLVWGEPIEVLFRSEFVYAPGRRDSSLEFPHFTYGSQTNPAVGVHITVSKWIKNKRNGHIVGAIVVVGIIGEGAFKGWAHLRFQGMSGPPESELE